MDRLPYSVTRPYYDLLGLKPTGPEQAAILESTTRFPCIGGGERGGKSWTTAALLFPHLLALPYVRYDDFFTVDGKSKFSPTNKPKAPHFLLLGPHYVEPRIEFQFIEQWLRQIGKLAQDRMNAPSKPQDGQWRLTTTDGVVLSTWSMEDPTSIRSLDLEGAGVCEAGACPYSGIERVQGRVSAKKGFIVYSGTMESANQWWIDWLLEGLRPNPRGVQSFSLPTWTNRFEFPGGRLDPEIKRLEAFYPEDIFAMRVAAEPRPPRFRVIKEVQQGHIRQVSTPEDATISLAIDPGYSSAYAVLFVAIWDQYEEVDGVRQFVGKRFHVLDELYEQGLDTEAIITLCQRLPLWPRVSEAVIDIAAQGHRDSTKSALEIWEKRTKFNFVRHLWPEDRLIERIRISARANQITIDPACKGLVAELGLGEPQFPEMHPWRFQTDKDARVNSERPIDRWNHSCKALGYLLLSKLGQVERLHSASRYNRLTGTRPPSIPTLPVVGQPARRLTYVPSPPLHARSRRFAH